MYFLSAFISKLVTGQAFTRMESSTPATQKEIALSLVLIVDSASARDQASI
jgi:hypothetical protein